MAEIKREDIISDDQIKAVTNFIETMAALAMRIVDLDKVGYSHIHKVMIKQLNDVVNGAVNDENQKEINITVKKSIKDIVAGYGYNKARDSDYNHRNTLRDTDSDLYYSGWMDCLDKVLEIKDK